MYSSCLMTGKISCPRLPVVRNCAFFNHRQPGIDHAVHKARGTSVVGPATRLGSRRLLSSSVWNSIMVAQCMCSLPLANSSPYRVGTGLSNPFFGGTGACGGTNSSLCTGLKPWLQSGTSGIGEWVWVSVLRSCPFTPCSEGLPDFPGVSASRDGGCCELRAILDFETTRCRGVGRTCKRTSA